MIFYIGGAILAGYLFVKAADVIMDWRMNRRQCVYAPTDDVLKNAKIATDRVDEMVRQMGAT